ncbi:FUSC family protein, partial [Hoyosella sp. G463]
TWGWLGATAAATGVTVALATLAAASPLAAGITAAAAALAQAPLNRRTLLLGAFLPIDVAVFASISAGSPLGNALWAAAGAAVIFFAMHRARIAAPAIPVALGLSRVHAVGCALVCGPLVALSVAFSLPHGYWAVAAFMMIFRPVSLGTGRSAANRLAGTLGGLAVVAVIALFLPHWAAALALIGCAWIGVGFAVMGDERRQTLWTTPLPILLGSGGDTLGAAWSRAELMGVGAILAVLVAAGAQRLLRPRDGDPPGGHGNPAAQ